MRNICLLFLVTVICSCSNLISYNYDFTTPLPEGATIFLIQDKGPSGLPTQLTASLRKAGLEVIGNNLLTRQVQGPSLQINTADTTYTTANSFPHIEELFERGEYDYVLRYSVARYQFNGSSIGNISLNLTETSSGKVIGTYTYRGLMLGVKVPSFLDEIAMAIREGKSEHYINPRLH